MKQINVKNIKIKHKFSELVTKSVNITEHQINECKQYAKNYVEESKEYKKLVPSNIKDEKLQKQIAQQAIFAQKIGECGVLNYLNYRGINSDDLNNKKISVKTCIDKDIHNRLIVDKNEFESKNNQNYYVGVHLNLQVEDKKDPIKRNLVKNIYDIKRVQVYGYLESKFMDELRYETIKNKDGKKEFKFYNKKASNYDKKDKYAKLSTECKWYYLDRVLDIEGLVMNIKSKNNK
ncbi:hypothetical protein CHF27_006720 [Romboutsia maritimum]|uniref:Uncharacterized protein n=1 Tax=Romboutsia maritimum TaxID=2020948 RepID=A0A371ITM5_9FIRM|nr:hypothetical protein [Romboutsia maritimum]RDY23809.1 hypothetical protein CHF27_006720 [Romboutsia maritimum]